MYLIYFVQLRLYSSENLANVKGGLFFAGFGGSVFAAAMSFCAHTGFPPGTVDMGSSLMIVRPMRKSIGKVSGGGRR